MIFTELSKFKEPEEKDIRLWIIRKLLRKGVLCKYHIDEDDLPKGAPPKYRKIIMDVLDEMVRNVEVIRFPHLGKKKICLNKEKRWDFEQKILKD